MPVLSFTVYGAAQPQGSMKAFYRRGARFPVLTSDNVKLKPWRQEVAIAALLAAKEQGFSTIKRPFAARAVLSYFFERPKSKSKATHKTTAPDLDKLQRATFDALTGIVFEDDSQVTVVRASKVFGSPARTEIVISLETEQRAA